MTELVTERRLADILAGERVEVDCGQVDGLLKKLLDCEVRAGRLIKWRGYWHPIPGASFGIGPLKTCYGTREAHIAVSMPDRT